MRIAIAEANAKAVDGENIAEAKIAAVAGRRCWCKKAEAYRDAAKARKREAEAAVIEVQNRAMAKAALAEAERVEAEQRAKLEAPAKAQKARIVVDAEAEAEKRRHRSRRRSGRDLTPSSKPKPAASTKSWPRRARACKQIVEACGGAQQAFQLLMLEHLDNLAEAVGQGDLEHQVRQDRRLGKRRRRTAARTRPTSCTSMAGTLPPMMQVMRDIGGVELPESLVKFAGDGDRVVKEPKTCPTT